MRRRIELQDESTSKVKWKVSIVANARLHGAMKMLNPNGQTRWIITITKAKGEQPCETQQQRSNMASGLVKECMEVRRLTP